MKKLLLCLSILCLLAANANATLYSIDKDPGHVLYGNLNQNTIPAPLGPVACGPTAAVNSFVYLERKYPSVYNRSLVPDLNADGLYQNNELVAVAQTLAGANFMNTAVPPAQPTALQNAPGHLRSALLLQSTEVTGDGHKPVTYKH